MESSKEKEKNYDKNKLNSSVSQQTNINEGKI